MFFRQRQPSSKVKLLHYRFQSFRKFVFLSLRLSEVFTKCRIVDLDLRLCP